MALTIVTPADGRIHQRSGTTGTITVTGTYTGSPTTIEARLVLDGTSTVVGSDWSTKVASPAGNAFSFWFAGVAQGGWYNVQIRDSAVPATVVTSGKVGVGLLIAVLGQSQAYLWFRSKGDSTLTANAKLRVTGNIGSWIAADPATSNGAIAFGNAVVTATGLPVGLIDYAWSGSGLIVTANGGQWVPTTNAPYAQFKSYVQGLDGAVEGCVWIQGESDAEGATVGAVTQATYYAGLTTLFATLRADFGASMPIVLALNATRTDGTVTGIDAGTEVVRNAQVQKCADTGIYRIEREDIPLDTDGVHHTPGGFTTFATRCAQAFNYSLGLVSYYRGPRITSVTRVNPMSIDVGIQHSVGSNFTPTTSITGFRITSGASPLTISSAVQLSPTIIRLTLASGVTTPLRVSHLYGATPTVTGVVKDNSPLNLPLEFYDGADLGAFMSYNRRGISINDNWLVNTATKKIEGIQSPTLATNTYFVVPGASGEVGLNGVLTITLAGTPATLTNPTLQATNSVNNYTQVSIQNKSSGANASADVIAYPDNVSSSDLTGFMDMGITSSAFAQAAYAITGVNEGYIFMSAPSGSGVTGDMIIATDSTGSSNNIIFGTNGFSTLANRKMKLAGATGNLLVGTMTDDTVNKLQVNGSTYASAYTTTTGGPLLAYPSIRTTDAASNLTLIRAGHAYAQAATNTTGAALTLAGGIGRRFFTVVDYTQLSGKTLTVTVNGVAVTGTEGVEFSAATSNAVTATNIGALITAGVSGVTVAVVSNVIYVTPNATTYSLTLATNAVVGAMTATNGVDGATIIKGTNTNDAAAVGMVGEIVTSTVAVGSKVSLTSPNAANVTSISLTAGDWDVSGTVDYNAGGATTFTVMKQGISTTSATIGAQDTFTNLALAGTLAAASDIAQSTPIVRISIASTTTVYLVAQATFATSTLAAYGTIRARRVR